MTPPFVKQGNPQSELFTALANMLTQAQPSSTMVDAPYVAQMNATRQQNEFERAKEQDYYNKVRALAELRAQGSTPSAMFQRANNFVGDFVTGNNPQEMAENVALNALPIAKILTELAPIARRGVGRVVTNTVMPVGYGQSIADKIRDIGDAGIGETIKAISDDVPLWKSNSKIADKYMSGVLVNADLRDTPYRMMFGLEPRYDKDLYVLNPDGSISFNQSRKYSLPLKYLNYSQEGWGSYGHNVMGDFSLGQRVGNEVPYYDKWDFGLNSGEKIIKDGNVDMRNLARLILDKLSKPVEIKGSYTYPYQYE